MSTTLTPQAIKAAEEFIASLAQETRRRGEAYFNEGRVVQFSYLPSGKWRAEVQGTKLYEVAISWNGKQWSASCNCPLLFRCKHVYAAMKRLLAQPGGKFSPERIQGQTTASKAHFKEFAAEKLGRELSYQERKIASAIHEIYRTYRNQKSMPEYMLRQIGTEHRTGYGWGERELWLESPPDAWQAWLYIAYWLKALQLGIPTFLERITPESEIREALGPWLQKREEQRWRKLLNELEADESRSEAPPVDFRVVLLKEEARLEFQEGAGAWSLLKKTRYEQMRREHSLSFVSDDARLVWSMFHRSDPVDGAHSYKAEGSQAALRELIRNPLLTERVLSEDRVPLHRSEQQLCWKIEELSDRGIYRLSLAFEHGTPPPDPLLCLQGRPTLYVTADTVYSAPPLWHLQPAPSKGNEIPASVLESPAGVRLLKRIQAPVPANLESRIEIATAKLIIEANLRDQWGVEHLEVRFLADWGDAAPMEVYVGLEWQPIDHKQKAKPKDSNRIVHLDRERLAAVPALVQNLGLTSPRDEEIWTRKTGRTFPEQFSSWLLGIPSHVELRLSRELASLQEAPLTAEFRLEVEPAGVDWFDVQTVLSVAEVEFSQEELRALLQAKGGWVRLGQKGWRKLALKWSEEDEEKLAELGLTSRALSPEPQRLHALQLASEKSKTLLPEEHYNAVRRRAEEIKTRVNPPVPASITAELRPYQVEGFHFLAYLSANRFGGVLADDMGLGKTVQTLTWLAWLRQENSKKRKASLVICPKSVTSNWQGEAAKFLPDLKVIVWAKGTEKALEAAIAEADLIVMNYAQVRVMAKVLTKRTWFAVILDEAQAIKNPDSQTARAACQLKADHRLALSGTPVENRLLDLWSIMAFAMPGILGTRARFVKAFEKTGEDIFARRRLAARVRPFLLRRTKEQVAKDLPPRTEEDLLCDLEGKQETLYKAELKRARQMLLKIASTRELDKQRFNILTSLLRLRQICCHPALVDAAATATGSAKMDALMELLEPLMAEDHKVLVFSQFVGVLELIREELIKREWQFSMLTGETEGRGELVQEFQSASGARVFLLSLKAGGAGLNLTAASYVVLFDPWWNPAVENQAIDRTHRIGQTEHVNAYRLLVRNTIEEKIRNLQKSKSALAEDILGEEAFARTLTLQDFQFLLGTDE